MHIMIKGNAAIFMPLLCLFSLNSYAAWSWKKMLFLTQEELITSSSTLKSSDSLFIYGLTGSITVKGNARSLFEVSALKKGIEEELPLTTISCSITDGKATVKTVEKDLQSTVRVNYIVTVPQKLSKITVISHEGPVIIEDVDASLDITTVEGDITVNNARNSVKAKATKRGSISVDQTIFPTTARIFIESMKGNVTLTLPKRVNADLNAHTLKGTVTSTIPVTLESRTTVLTRESWERLMREAHGTFGVSGGPITIDLTKGNIAINGK